MPVLQWSERHVVDRPANMHQNALIFVVPAVALLTPWMQNSFKIVENHRWQHVICRRSCPPRGGPIRSVLIFIKEIENTESNLRCNKTRGQIKNETNEA